MNCFTICPKNDVYGMKRNQKKLLFKAGVTIGFVFREGKTWTAFRNLIFYERGAKCSICGFVDSSKSLHIHHIKPVYKFPELAFEKDNCIVLCKTCHKKQHPTGWSYNYD